MRGRLEHMSFKNKYWVILEGTNKQLRARLVKKNFLGFSEDFISYVFFYRACFAYMFFDPSTFPLWSRLHAIQ
jgi:hypothetical protein